MRMIIKCKIVAYCKTFLIMIIKIIINFIYVVFQKDDVMTETISGIFQGKR
jgi:hypothetical protein